MITINGQEYHLQLVDTAGQVCISSLHQSIAMCCYTVLFGVFFLLVNASDCVLFSCFRQDEYSIFPQTYSIDINGYILVYSVTSNKRFV